MFRCCPVEQQLSWRVARVARVANDSLMNEWYLGTVGSTPHQEHVRIFALACKTHPEWAASYHAHACALAPFGQEKKHPAKRPSINHLHTLMQKANQSAPACTTNSSGFRLSVAPTFPQPSFAFLRWSVEAKGCAALQNHPPAVEERPSLASQRSTTAGQAGTFEA